MCKKKFTIHKIKFSGQQTVLDCNCDKHFSVCINQFNYMKTSNVWCYDFGNISPSVTCLRIIS